MGWFILAHIFSTILSFVQVGRLSDKDKDLEVIIFRQIYVCVSSGNNEGNAHITTLFIEDV